MARTVLGVLLVVAALLAVFVLPPVWGGLAIVVAAVIEVGETTFWIRFSRRRRVQVGAETLIGAVGRVTSACCPDGQMRLRGEIWGARCERGAEPGETVRVVRLDGLTLVVEPVEGRK